MTDETEQRPLEPIEDAPLGGARLSRVAAVALGLIVALLVAVLATRDTSADRQSQSPLIGRIAPTTVGITLDGEAIDLEDFRGRWVAVNFFASWCIPCIQEHPELRAWDEARRQAGDGALISVTYDNDSDDAREFFADNGGTWPVIDDPENRIGVAYGVAQVPETFIVHPDGTIVQKFAGAVTQEDLDAVLEVYEAQR